MTRTLMTFCFLASLIPATNGRFAVSWVLEAGNKTRQSATRSLKAREKELPPAEYKVLRAQILENAKAEIGPKIKNPEVRVDGLESAVANVLQNEHSYWLAARHLVRDHVEITQHGTSTPGGHHDSAAAEERKLGAKTEPPITSPANPNGSTASSICRQPMVRSVNGQTKAVVFTPQIPNNFYRIEGCFFGAQLGRVLLRPESVTSAPAHTPPITLELNKGAGSWSASQIDVHLDPSLAGLPDFAAKLIVQPSKGEQIELPGCFFVAARGTPQVLSMIPASWVKLEPSAIRTRTVEQLEYVSPPVKGKDVPSDADGTSAFVMRSDSEPFGGGADTYNFSELGPGWVVDSVRLQTYLISCPGCVTYTQSLGKWSAEWSGRTLKVSFRNDVCISLVPPSFAFHLSGAQYAAKVWVVGPRGTRPITRE